MPDVAAEVDEDCVDAFEVIEECGEVVVVLDLCGWVAALEAEVAAEFFCKFVPIYSREGDVVGVEVAGGAAEFGRVGYAFKLVYLFLEACYKYVYFLAEFGR